MKNKNNIDLFENINLSQFVEKYIDYDVDELVFKRKKIENITVNFDFRFAIEQISIRQKNFKKFPILAKNYDFIFPTVISTEQSSSEITALYKSNIVDSYDFSLDLTGGLGIDSLFFAEKAKQHFYCEINPVYCDFFEQNCENLNKKNIKIFNQNAENFLELYSKKDKNYSKGNEQFLANFSEISDQKFDILYIDPSRRNNSNQRQLFLNNLQPNILELQKFFKQISKKTIIKLSPMFDISKAVSEISNISEIHIISVNNECKELLLLLDFDNIFENKSIKYFAINLKNSSNSGDIHKIVQEKIELSKKTDFEIEFSEPQKFIYEPNSSIMKLGFWSDFCQKYSLKKLHKNTHLFTSNEFLADFQGKIFELLNVTSFSNKEIKKNLNGENKANITVRNFCYSAEEVRKRLKLADGGSFHIFATTTVGNKYSILITKKVKN